MPSLHSSWQLANDYSYVQWQQTAAVSTVVAAAAARTAFGSNRTVVAKSSKIFAATRAAEKSFGRDEAARE